jgi:hypothetical protein
MSQSKAPIGVLLNLTERIVAVVLIVAAFVFLGLSFRTGIDRGDEGRLEIRGSTHFTRAVCAILSVEKQKTGRYVCDPTANRNMQDLGLSTDEAVLQRTGKTLPEWIKDTKFLNDALKAAFALPRIRGGNGDIGLIGWGMDAGYVDFVQLSFRLLGHKVESLYLTFFLLLAISTGLIVAQFYDRLFILFSVCSLHYAFFTLGHLLPNWELLNAVNNPRFLSFLVIIPFLHALFLMVYVERASAAAVFLFLPQAILMVASGNFRATGYWAPIALGLCCAGWFAVCLLRRKAPFGPALLRCWPGLVVLICLLCGAALVRATVDKRLASMGGIRSHAFWQPLYYDLQNHPDWGRKYSAEHEGAAGDDTAVVAAASYRKRHGLLHEPMTQSSYERYVRGAIVEFVRKDPWYFVELKYYNAIGIVRIIKEHVVRTWGSLERGYCILGLLAGVALFIQVRRKKETLGSLTWCAAVLAISSVLVVAPVWALVFIIDAMFDSVALGILASLGLALWAGVTLAVLATDGAVGLLRKLA